MTATVTRLCDCWCHTGDLDTGPRSCGHCTTNTVTVLPAIDIPLPPREDA
jgi:hypothetical protein